jgi:methionine sulfoxide reductase heme-binding subunit
VNVFDNGNAVWFLMRGSGVASLLLLTGVMALGIATRGAVRLSGLPRFATVALHRSMSLLSVVFIGIHVATAVIDPYAAVRLVDVFVPFIGNSRPLYVGLGALAVDLILALVVTGLLRERIGRRTWRAIHWGAYATWPVALIHAIGMGTDTSTIWLRALGIASVAVVSGSLAWRVLLPSDDASPAAARS